MPSRGRLNEVTRLLLLLPLALMACGDDSSDLTSAPRDDQRYTATATILESPDHGPQLCLGGVAESYPPQCGGPDIVGWSWDDVDGEERASGTTWVTASVVGTFDGERFTLTEPPGPPATPEPSDTDFSPACDDYDRDATARDFAGGVDGIADLVAMWVSDPAGEWDGPLVVSVVVRPGAADDAEGTIRERWDGALCVVERDLPTLEELLGIQQEIGSGEGAPFELLSSSTDERNGVVKVSVVLADEEARRWVDDRWGDRVELESALEPVSE